MEATSVDDIVKILKDPAHYPSPVRAVGSNHSTAPVGVADGGTLIKMSKMNRILEIGTDTVTVQAGAIAIDVAHELQKHGLQFYVNTEIGSLSVGSAACAGTKDASMPGEYGQVGSYITRIKMVLPSGELLEVSDDQPELMQKVRSCYGTFGIVYEATYRIRPIVPMAVRHETFKLADSSRKLPDLKTSGESLMYYMFPFEDLITVEFRHYNPGAKGDPDQPCVAAAQLYVGHCGPAVLLAGGGEHSGQDGALQGDRRVLRALAIQVGEPGTQRQHGGHGPDHSLSAGVRRQPLHVQPVGVPRRNLSHGAAAILRILQKVLSRRRAIATTCCTSDIAS